jgi:hypothetical protein
MYGGEQISESRQERRLEHINLQLAALGQPVCQKPGRAIVLEVADNLVRNYLHHRHLLAEYLCPADRRIQEFLNAYLEEHDVDARVALPDPTFVLDQPGLARELSLPADANAFQSEYLESYRVLQGVLHNPKNDRRTTQGVFHIVAGGLRVPSDKRAVPPRVFAALFQAALRPPEEAMRLPITAGQADAAAVWVSLLVRPTVSPEVVGVAPGKRMEVRFFAPGGLVANLDFIESIFGNAGDPSLPENDAALDILHWTGHTGCVLIAPHLVKLRKKDLGLPHYDEATARQRRDGMCWRSEGDLYNDGVPFKVVCRDRRGVIVTLIADNYFGYSKKEIKSQISYAANLFGRCEEEHSGGALVFPRVNLGERFYPRLGAKGEAYAFEDLTRSVADRLEVRVQGYAVDRQYADIAYLPEDACIDLPTQRITWHTPAGMQSIKLLAGHTYVYPSGYKVHLERHPHAPSWRLIGTEAEGLLCHKPSTVSGGGKSEIAKSITGAVISGALYVDDLERDLDQVEAIFTRDYSVRFRDPAKCKADSRPLLDMNRSLGSVIRLLTPSAEEYTEAYNRWLAGIPQHIFPLVFVIKRFYQEDWGDDWRSRFSVDVVNGYPGHEFKCDGRRLIASYLRVGFEPEGGWRIFKLRQDFIPAEKVQVADDITVTTVVPAACLDGLPRDCGELSVKLLDNCEMRLFQRPDEAVLRGTDLQTEADLAGRDNFISNFEPLGQEQARELVDDVIHFEEFSCPMRDLIRAAANNGRDTYFVSSAHPRLVNGRPSPNVRYLQPGPEQANPRAKYLAEVSTRLARRLPLQAPLYFPVQAVLPGRRNNPPDRRKGICSLAVYNPIHYQELPELFMDFVCSLTGKSPSTTGAGSEGALTKGPFNALSATADLNNALVSFVLCGHHAFSSAAGHIGPAFRIDHDISLLIPEIWCRLSRGERDPDWLIAQGYLEKLEDFDYQGRTVHASRLGYRITAGFVHAFLGKIFDNPRAVFDESILRPERQDMAAFVAGVHNITEAQRRVAQQYFDDGSVDDACPPLKALLHIMAGGDYQGRDIADPGIRLMFTRDYLLNSEWYQARLTIKQARDVELWQRHTARLEALVESLGVNDGEATEPIERLQLARRTLAYVRSARYRRALLGTIGADWLDRATAAD